jgi:hypothetical protein
MNTADAFATLHVFILKRGMCLHNACHQASLLCSQRVYLFRNLPLKMSNKPSRTLTFKCKKCSKPVQVFLQKVSACSHIQPYQGICKCGEVMRHATGQKDAVESYLASPDGNWSHHHH